VSLTALVAAAAISLPGLHAYRSQPPAGGSILQGVIPYAQADRTLNPSIVYLPPNFSPARRYPVAYLLHGMPGSPLEYAHYFGILDWIDTEIAAGKLRPFIAVAPSAAQRTGGEWAGFWEQYVVHGVIPWVDSHLPTIASPRGRVLAGLSAGGFGAYDIGLRHPGLFGRLVSWSGYFHPLPDGPFVHASPARLAANDPWLILRAEGRKLRADGIRFFVSTGPPHSHWEQPSETIDFGRALARAGLPVTVRRFGSLREHWVEESHAGLLWAFGEPQPARAT
jgi:enterochelin esterase-like enzyme